MMLDMTMTQAGTNRVYDGDEARWAAVRNRDAAADGIFYYSVATTGVFCRPSCAARTPRRENVAFHDSPAAAARAGYRPCKRCRPDEIAPSAARDAAIAAACRAIETAEETPSLEELAAAAGFSPFHFHRLFKRATGVTPRQYAASARAKRLRDQLPETATVTRAIYESGFNSTGHFYAEAGGLLGMTPRAFRAGGYGEEIRFGIGQSSLGAVLVATTLRGICAIMLGDEPTRLEGALRQRFKNAALVAADRDFAKTLAAIVAQVEAPGGSFDLPLDIRGTAFEQRVWQALRAIPAGTTASYAELARRIGKPKAARAVGHACAANPVAVAIPCHRAVASNGALTGYRWGIARKRELLKREAKT
jgi:AraC family transcriptional regulator, regulatory protein of adaptative response / methylated-DNA-[protein]-cysteine methyltransferase